MTNIIKSPAAATAAVILSGAVVGLAGFFALRVMNAGNESFSYEEDATQPESADTQSDYTPLEKDLAQLKVPFISPGNVSWAEAIRPFNKRPATVIPRVVVQATTIQHVQDAVRCAVKHGLKVSAKSGGHSYANYGLGGEDGHMVIRLDQMYGVQYHSSDHTATIKAGSRIGHVATELYMQGKRGISHGSCPGVGLAGHALHGGYGFSSHLYGLALDWVKGCKIVLADGSLKYASKKENADLFWALRGAGSSFGIVVEFDVDTFSVPPNLTWARFVMGIGRDRDVALDSLKRWQQFVEDYIPSEMLVRIRISEDETGSLLEAMCHGLEGDAMCIVEELDNILELDWTSDKSDIEMCNWPEHLRAFSERPDGQVNLTGPSDTQDSHYASSLVTRHIPDEGLEAFVDYWFSVGKADLRKKWWIHMDLHGGQRSAISRVPNDATAYPHRDKQWLFQFFCPTDEQTDLKETYKLMNGFMDSITGSLKEGDWGRYANYTDSELGREEALQQYYGKNLPQLRKLKARWDPEDVFHHPQSVTPAKLE